jgi:glycosyltransferase involved in cell wall biosynthesis
MFLEALAEKADVIDLLFYLWPDIQPHNSEDVRRELAAAWGIEANVFLCQRENPARTHRLSFNRTVGPMLSLFQQSSYTSTSGHEQLDALRYCLSRVPDLVFAHRLQAMSPILRLGEQTPPVYFDLDDVEHIKLARTLRAMPSWRRRLFNALMVPALLLGERRAALSACKTFVCSEQDREYLSGLLRFPRVEAIPNSVAITTQEKTDEAETTCVFIGNYGYEPNILAAELLVKTIWPLIRRLRPDARLLIVGDHPEQVPSYHEIHEGVQFTGFVQELGSIYRRTAVVCCPITVGSGTRLKIIEAAVHGKAVVSTQIGAEGLEFRDGSEILIRSSPEDFAAACVTLLSNDNLRRSIGQAAMARSIECYDRKNILQKIREEIFTDRA